MRETTFTLHAFQKAIADRDLSDEVWRRNPQTLREALSAALRAESWRDSWQRRSRDFDRDRDVPRNRAAARGVKVNESEDRPRDGRRPDSRPRDKEGTTGARPTNQPEAASAASAGSIPQGTVQSQQLQQELQFYRQHFGPVSSFQQGQHARPDPGTSASAPRPPLWQDNRRCYNVIRLDV